jgi:hypothetical protein
MPLVRRKAIHVMLQSASVCVTLTGDMVWSQIPNLSRLLVISLASAREELHELWHRPTIQGYCSIIAASINQISALLDTYGCILQFCGQLNRGNSQLPVNPSFQIGNHKRMQFHGAPEMINTIGTTQLEFSTIPAFSYLRNLNFDDVLLIAG